MINRPSAGINLNELGLNRPSIAQAKAPHQKDLFVTIKLGNESIEYASRTEIQNTLNKLQSICEKNLSYNTNLQQGQLTHALASAIKHNYIKLLAKKETGESITQSEISLNKIFINEYEAQHKTYRNIKQPAMIEGPDMDQISLIAEQDDDNVIKFKPVYINDANKDTSSQKGKVIPMYVPSELGATG